MTGSEVGNLYITWLEDEYNCEMCGYSSAQGATVHLDGEIIVDATPYAQCYDDVSFSNYEIFKETYDALKLSMPELEEEEDSYSDCIITEFYTAHLEGLGFLVEFDDESLVDYTSDYMSEDDDEWDDD